MTATEAYNILNIIPPCTKAQLKNAYRQAVLTHHPDHGGQSATFQRVQEAWEYLKGINTERVPPSSARTTYSDTSAASFYANFQRQNVEEMMDKFRIDGAVSQIEYIMKDLTPHQKLQVMFQLKMKGLY